MKYYEEYRRLSKEDRTLERSVGSVEIRGTKTEGLPMWMINYYIKSTCDNYAKLVSILNILEIFSDEESDIVDIGISTASVPVDRDGREFEEKLIGCVQQSAAYTDKSDAYCLMRSEPEEGRRSEKKPRDFAHYFNSCERPVCFAITKNQDVILLHDPRGREGIKICDISYHSPIDINLSGVPEIVRYLLTADARASQEKRLQEEHDEKMLYQKMQTVGEAARNMEEMIRIVEKLQTANLPEGQKALLQTMCDVLMTRQAKLNEQIGVRVPGLDVRG